MKRRTRIVAAVLCAGMLGAVPVTAAATPLVSDSVVAQQGKRGDLVSVVKIGGFTKAQAAEYVTKYDLDPANVRYGVDLYRITYRTTGLSGRSTTASALVVLPRTDTRTLRTVAWLHGTLVYRGYAASLSDNGDRTAAVQFAAAGYATAAPDYLGLGEGPGHHPYIVTNPTVTASIDSLHATRTLAARSGKRLDREVLVSGFSQGGQASMLVGRALQQGAGGYFGVGGIAPISGPHDIRRVELPAALEDGRLDGRSAAFYLGYVVTAWNRVYQIYDSPADVFRPEYAEVAEKWFDGTSFREEQIFPALPDSPRKLFTDEFFAELANPTGKLRQILEANDDACQDWRPRVPVRLYAGTADRDVAYANSESCLADVRASGGKAKLINVGAVDHFTSVRVALPQVLGWFNRS